MSKIVGATRGFTIVELLVVIVVVAILAVITIVSFNGITDRAQKTTMKSDISAAYKAISIYFAYNNRYPASATDLMGGGDTAPLKRSTFSMANDPYRWVIYCTDGANAVIAGRKESSTTWWVAMGSNMPLTENVAAGTSGSTATTCPLLGIPTYTYATWVKANAGWSGNLK